MMVDRQVKRRLFDVLPARTTILNVVVKNPEPVEPSVREVTRHVGRKIEDLLAAPRFIVGHAEREFLTSMPELLDEPDVVADTGTDSNCPETARIRRQIGEKRLHEPPQRRFWWCAPRAARIGVGSALPSMASNRSRSNS